MLYNTDCLLLRLRLVDIERMKRRLIQLKAILNILQRLPQVSDLIPYRISTWLTYMISEHVIVCLELHLGVLSPHPAVQGISSVLESSSLLLEDRDYSLILTLKPQLFPGTRVSLEDAD